jgi:hypothetical protein
LASLAELNFIPTIGKKTGSPGRLMEFRIAFVRGLSSNGEILDSGPCFPLFLV